MRIMVAGVALTAILVGRAQAMDGPFTWMESVCYADAVVEVEVTLSTPTSKPRVTVLQVLWTRFARAKVRPQLHFGLWDRRQIARQLEDPEIRKNKMLAPLYEAALRRGSYRATHFVYLDKDRSWAGVMGVVEYSRIHWHDNPNHDRLWKHVEPLLLERTRVEQEQGKGAKPKFCADVEDARFLDRQEEVEVKALGID